MKYPDYNNSLVNLTCSILHSFGAKHNHKTLPCLDPYLHKGYQNIVLMIFDGMGTENLKHHLPKDSFLRSHMVDTISSVFPPTTTAAITSILSGLTPYEHGWLGWSLYYKEIDKIVELFPNTVKDSAGVHAADYHVAERYIPYEDISHAIKRSGNGSMHMVSPFAEHPVFHQEELIKSVRQICSGPGRKFIYTYWYQPDDTMHKTGCTSKQTEEAIVKIDKSVEALCKTLHDTLVIVTADHGHTDVRYEFVCDHPNIMNAIIRPTAIESRAAAFYVKEECKKHFPEEFQKAFGEEFLLMSRDEVLSSGLFGNGDQHPRFIESIGDYLAISTAGVSIAYSHASKQFISNHAGLTEQEMMVPLIVIKRPAI